MPRRLTAATLGLLTSVFIATAPSAGAVPGPQPAPNWSGLDVTGGVNLPGTPGVPVSEVPLSPELGLSGAGAQQRFVYSTVDQHGEEAASTAAVFLPTGEAPEGGWPVLAWAHGTTGLGDDCTPSAQFIRR